MLLKLHRTLICTNNPPPSPSSPKHVLLVTRVAGKTSLSVTCHYTRPQCASLLQQLLSQVSHEANVSLCGHTDETDDFQYIGIIVSTDLTDADYK